ncbi:glypican-4 [Macrobrachium rosenbergii]|uniref:glypican-4 n=1 Tax=Macrobrachium rosenbergii TaxID=79674 RepID=UPI0034D407C0
MARLLVMVVVLAAVMGLDGGGDVSATSVDSCSPVSGVYLSKGFRDRVPSHPIPGDHLKMCQGETTCCTDVMERKLSVESRQEFDNNLKNLLNPMASLLAKKNVKLNDLFGKLLNFSRRSFDEMFSKTYGIIYQQNAYVFTNLYDNLEKYFKHGELDLKDTMDDFFKMLYQRMFTVFNAQYSFTPKYLQCVTQHMEALQPFGEVPKKLTTQIKRSFVALRTFVQGLATGRDVVKNVLKENLSKTCVHELMRMTHCPTCAGLMNVQACMPYCRDVINVCLAHHQPLVAHWIAYVDAMVDVGDRLENPFNIENVVQPVNYKVSDAIMNFQEAGHEISTKVFQGCGSPRLGRNTREVVTGELSQEFLEFSNSRQDEDITREAESISVSRHIHEIKTKIKNSRDFWTELPNKMCKDAMRQDSSNCWTGVKLGKYDAKPSLNGTKATPSSEMNVQIMRLKVITSKLREAYNGRDVSWIDDESWLNNGGKQDEEAVSREEGSGSGSSFPHSPGHYPPDDEDGYANSDSYAGSGADGYDISTSEGSGDYGSGDGWRKEVYEDVPIKVRGKDRGSAPPMYDPHSPSGGRPRNPKPEAPHGGPEQPPSAAAKESMSLYRAITIYMLPAFIMFLGSIA